MIASTQLDTLAAFVPMPVAISVYAHPQPITAPVSRRFTAATLFADISGFTPLSELLSQAGPAGIEELTRIINDYFTRMIDLIRAHRGQVVKFSGDAITAIFPADETHRRQGLAQAVYRAGLCSLEMQAAMVAFANLKTSRGTASLSMKVGIGAGRLIECSIGGALGRWEYVVGGDAVVQMATAEVHALPGQVLLSPQAWRLGQRYFEGQEVMPGRGLVQIYHAYQSLLPESLEPIDWRTLTATARETAAQALRCYIPGAIKARLDHQDQWLAELRRLTVLFIGVGGFDYEADDITARLQTFLHDVQEVTYRYEGSLSKVVVDDKGTVLIVLFGAPPFSHEDDATRAIACALGLQTVAHRQHLRMAIGITEGAIFAGPIGAPTQREYTVIGDEVNQAARLMQYGTNGDILISERVRDRAEDRFLLEAMPQISIKGKTQAINTFLVKGEQGVQDEIVTRYLIQEDRLIGRKAELEQLRRLAGRVWDGELRVLFAEGEMGIGKSRLTAEMVREWMQRGGVGYGSKCLSYSRNTPYQGWREILAAIFGGNVTLTPQRQLDRLASQLVELDDPDRPPGYWLDRLPLLAEILGLEAPDSDFTRQLTDQTSHQAANELRRDNTFALITAILKHEARKRPLLILLEDIHWADELTLALAAYVARNLSAYPVLLALFYRPVAVDQLGELAELWELPFAETLYLEPLSDQESLNLVNTLFGGQIPTPAIESLLLNKGQGNPFFLQEITRAIQHVHQDRTLDAILAPDGVDVPDRVQDVILSRIDRLTEDEKLTLKIASVIGATFQRLLLSEIHPMNNAQVVLPDQLEHLENERLLRLESPAPKWEYVFRNVIAQEVVYEGLLLSQRRHLHELVGQALEFLMPERIDQLAFHFSRSTDYEKALHYLQLAGQKALRESANHAAIGYYTQMLQCLAEQAEAQEQSIISPLYWDTLLIRSQLYNKVGLRDEELEDLGTLGLVAEVLDDKRRRALSARQWAMLYETSGDYASALEMIERCVSLAEPLADSVLLGQGYNHWGRLLYLSGRYDQAQTYLERARSIALAQDERSLQAENLLNQGLVAHYRGDYETAQQQFEASRTLWEAMGNQVGWAEAEHNLGRLYYDLGWFSKSYDCLQDVIEIHRRMGHRLGEAATLFSLAQVERSLGFYREARTLFEKALVFSQSIEDRHSESDALYHLGFVMARLQDFASAEVYLEEALLTLRELEAPWWAQVRALIYYSWTLWQMGRLDEAQEMLVEATETERDTQQKTVMIEDMALLAQITLDQGDLNQARSWVQYVLLYLQRQGVVGVEHPAMVYLACYRVLLAAGEVDAAAEVLTTGQATVQQIARRITKPEVQQQFLEAVPENNELLALQTDVVPPAPSHS